MVARINAALNASACGLQVREYGHMLRNDAAYAHKAQRISELELSENKPSAETVQKIQSGFESIIAQRGEKLGLLRQDYDSCKNSLMERVGEYEYEL